MIETLRDIGSTPRYTELFDSARSLEEVVFRETNVSDWLFAQKRTSAR